MNTKLIKTMHDFLSRITAGDHSLYECAMSNYLAIFEGTSTDSAIDMLRNAVGDNQYATDGSGIFNLSNDAGFDGDMKDSERIDAAISAGLSDGSLDDFGTALATDASMPTEGDFGFDDASQGGSDFGLDLDGEEFAQDDSDGAEPPPDDSDDPELDDDGLGDLEDLESADTGSDQPDQEAESSFTESANGTALTEAYDYRGTGASIDDAIWKICDRILDKEQDIESGESVMMTVNLHGKLLQVVIASEQDAPEGLPEYDSSYNAILLPASFIKKYCSRSVSDAMDRIHDDIKIPGTMYKNARPGLSRAEHVSLYDILAHELQHAIDNLAHGDKVAHPLPSIGTSIGRMNRDIQAGHRKCGMLYGSGRDTEYNQAFDDVKQKTGVRDQMMYAGSNTEIQARSRELYNKIRTGKLPVPTTKAEMDDMISYLLDNHYLEEFSPKTIKSVRGKLSRIVGAAKESMH